MRTLGFLLFAATVLAQGHHRTENRALLGVVATPVANKDKLPDLVLAHVLKKSPAEKAGLKQGDALLSIGGKDVAKPQDVDKVLAGYAGGENVAIEYRRGGKQATTEAKLIARDDYRGDFLKPQRRGATKFKAPEWFVYAWAQAGEAPPTRKSTKKKVVVIHCFQSW